MLSVHGEEVDVRVLTLPEHDVDLAALRGPAFDVIRVPEHQCFGRPVIADAEVEGHHAAGGGSQLLTEQEVGL